MTADWTGIQRNQLIILGAGVMQGPAIALAREMGLETVVVDGDPHAIRAPWADRFEPIDLKDKEGIEALARSLQREGRLAGIMTAGTDFSATAAWVAQQLGLPGIPYEAALNASDKERMRRRFHAAGIPAPRFVVLQDPPGRDFSLPFAYPAVVKPVDNMGGRGCRRVDSPEDLEAAVPGAIKFSRSSRVIVEEYLDGPEFSVDALVYRGEITICGLADRHIFFPPYFIEMGHTMPAALDAGSAALLLEAFKEGVRALGLAGKDCFGAAKGDLKLTSQGPRIGEIAARLSGGYMSGWTYPYASGVEVTRGAIMAALGQVPSNLSPARSWTSAERAFISIPGTVRSLYGLDEAGSLPYVKDVFRRVRPGERVAFPENNVAKCGNIITAAADRETAVSAAESAVRSVRIRLKAPDAETDAFLSRSPGASRNESGFPPDAFSLPLELADQAAVLPESVFPPASAVQTAPPGPSLIPFPALARSGLRDYQGRTVEESLIAVRELSGFPLPLDGASHAPSLGRGFWAALIRGGYQGALYYIDRYVLPAESQEG
ncbi:MAG: ATP-grasp domain-containing protein [Spirochaetaceae bacterium]|jgi:biotin carboxylase|nr:ATP-grasp domain-containing protein [Spirochaetaceae bacterium]